MKQTLLHHLETFPKKTISYDELDTFNNGNTSYELFAEAVLQIEKDGVLEMVKAQGRTSRTPSLALRYRIQTHTLNRAFYERLQTYHLNLHPLIKLDAYFKFPHSTCQEDLPFSETTNQKQSID